MPMFRVARVSDARAVAELAENTFRDTFAAHNCAQDMDAHCLSSYGEAIQAAEISSASRVTLVAEHDKRLVAYAQMKWGEAPDCVLADSPGEIHRLYVDKNWHGKGLAHELMTACLKVLQERQTDVTWLGVWERNPRAISFYSKFDFREVGDQAFRLGADVQRDIVMVRKSEYFEPE